MSVPVAPSQTLADLIRSWLTSVSGSARRRGTPRRPRQLRQPFRLVVVHAHGQAVDHVAVLECHLDIAVEVVVDVGAQPVLAVVQMGEVGAAGRRRDVQPVLSGDLRTGRPQPCRAAGVGGQRRLLELDDPQPGTVAFGGDQQTGLVGSALVPRSRPVRAGRRTARRPGGRAAPPR